VRHTLRADLPQSLRRGAAALPFVEEREAAALRQTATGEAQSALKP